MPDQSPFACQFIHVWAREPTKGGLVEHPRVEQLGERAFIVGKLCIKPGSTEVRTGLTMWVPVDDVLMITEYPDLERVAEASAQSKERNAAKEGKRWF